MLKVDQSNGRKSVRQTRVGGQLTKPTLFEDIKEDGDVFNTSKSKNLVRYANTFKMDPDFNIRKCVSKIQRIIEVALTAACEEQYEPYHAKDASKKACNDIHKALKQLHMDRYKFVVHANVGQYGKFDLKYSSKCLWDSKTDTYVDGSIVNKNTGCFGFATVFCVYYE